jgi:hypothetical protein
LKKIQLGEKSINSPKNGAHPLAGSKIVFGASEYTKGG